MSLPLQRLDASFILGRSRRKSLSGACADTNNQKLRNKRVLRRNAHRYSRAQLVVTYRTLVGDDGNFYEGLLDRAVQGCDPGLDRPLTAEQPGTPPITLQSLQRCRHSHFQLTSPQPSHWLKSPAIIDGMYELFDASSGFRSALASAPALCGKHGCKVGGAARDA
jgi:hypothetical protein